MGIDFWFVILNAVKSVKYKGGYDTPILIKLKFVF